MFECGGGRIGEAVVDVGGAVPGEGLVWSDRVVFGPVGLDGSVALGPIDGRGGAADDGGVTRSLAVPASAFAGFRFPPDVILLAVRWYLRYSLSYRDVEELLAERGVEVDHASRCSGGCSGSRRCSPKPLVRADIWSVTAGLLTRPTSRSRRHLKLGQRL